MDLRLMICAALALLSGACTTTTTTVSSDGVSKTTNERSTKVTEADLRHRARARTDLAAGYYRNGQLAVALDEARRAVRRSELCRAYGLLGYLHGHEGAT